jgi:hypothetical protein
VPRPFHQRNNLNQAVGRNNAAVRCGQLLGGIEPKVTSQYFAAHTDTVLLNPAPAPFAE